ncbi:hypothetical protein SCHPADRAFT_929008 [Schizopora paradoxa]|uniref:Uncharacterized protein n=1 Tax=Schizopora paradoxa TaxID=27342 RepID=A0A0H2S7C8_9AGAM|nr:hypothetical protein SCHPADRAFT_929008 [Schizopora paradoxa]
MLPHSICSKAEMQKTIPSSASVLIFAIFPADGIARIYALCRRLCSRLHFEREKHQHRACQLLKNGSSRLWAWPWWRRIKGGGRELG